jgi:hypothetical protein
LNSNYIADILRYRVQIRFYRMRQLLILVTVLVLVQFALSAPGYSDEWELSDRVQNYERNVAAPTDDTDEQIQPELQNYDAVVAKPHCCFICWRCSGRKRRSTDYATAVSSFVKIFGSDVEQKLYNSFEDLKKLHETPVVRSDLYERPLASTVPEFTSRILKGKQYGVVVTLSDGRRFLLVKGNQLGRGKDTVAIIYDHMTDDWTKVESKEVKSSTFDDFFQAGGRKYDVVSDNGNQAAARMMQLP